LISAATAVPQSSTKSSLLAQAGDEVGDQLREAVILATLISTPAVIEDFESQIEQMDCIAPGHAHLRDTILRVAADMAAGTEQLSDEARQELGADVLESLFALPHVRIAPPVRQPGNLELARMTVAEELRKKTLKVWRTRLSHGG